MTDPWSGPAEPGWPAPPWTVDPAVRAAERRARGTRLGLIALASMLAGAGLGFLGFVTLLAGIGILIMGAGAVAWLASVPLGVASLVVLWRSGCRPVGSMLLRSLPGLVAAGLPISLVVVGYLEQLSER